MQCGKKCIVEGGAGNQRVPKRIVPEISVVLDQDSQYAEPEPEQRVRGSFPPLLLCAVSEWTRPRRCVPACPARCLSGCCPRS